jgi:hypothetical protein
VADQISTTEIGTFTRVAAPIFPDGNYIINPESFNPNKENSF